MSVRYRLTVVAETPNPDYKPSSSQSYGYREPAQEAVFREELIVVLSETQYQAVQKAVLETFQ